MGKRLFSSSRLAGKSLVSLLCGDQQSSPPRGVPSCAPLSPADSMETVSEVEPAGAPHLAAGARRTPSADELLAAVEPVLCEALVGQVGASFQVDIALPSGARSSYFIDLSSGHCSSGSCGAFGRVSGAPATPLSSGQGGFCSLEVQSVLWFGLNTLVFLQKESTGGKPAARSPGGWPSGMDQGLVALVCHQP